MLTSQTLNGILLIFILIIMLKLINDRHIMGEYINSKSRNIVTVITIPLFVINYLDLTKAVKSITERKPILHLDLHKFVNLCKLDHLLVRNTKKLQYFIEFMYTLISK